MTTEPKRKRRMPRRGQSPRTISIRNDYTFQIGVKTIIRGLREEAVRDGAWALEHEAKWRASGDAKERLAAAQWIRYAFNAVAEMRYWQSILRRAEGKR